MLTICLRLCFSLFYYGMIASVFCILAVHLSFSSQQYNRCHNIFCYEQLDVLGDVVGCVNNQLPVFYEANLMRGTDVFKAIALGAKAVFLNQQFIWGYMFNVSYLFS